MQADETPRTANPSSHSPAQPHPFQQDGASDIQPRSPTLHGDWMTPTAAAAPGVSAVAVAERAHHPYAEEEIPAEAADTGAFARSPLYPPQRDIDHTSSIKATDAATHHADNAPQSDVSASRSADYATQEANFAPSAADEEFRTIDDANQQSDYAPESNDYELRPSDYVHSSSNYAPTSSDDAAQKDDNIPQPSDYTSPSNDYTPTNTSFGANNLATGVTAVSAPPLGGHEAEGAHTTGRLFPIVRHDTDMSISNLHVPGEFPKTSSGGVFGAGAASEWNRTG